MVFPRGVGGGGGGGRVRYVKIPTNRSASGQKQEYRAQTCIKGAFRGEICFLSGYTIFWDYKILRQTAATGAKRKEKKKRKRERERERERKK